MDRTAKELLEEARRLQPACSGELQRAQIDNAEQAAAAPRALLPRGDRFPNRAGVIDDGDHV
jgi:hypothetical protein